MHATIDGFDMPDAAAVETAAARFRLLADPTRLRVLCALAQGETSVACLAELAGAGVPTVSQHLAKLRLAGVVRARRQGVFVFHELVGAGAGAARPAAVRRAAHRGGGSVSHTATCDRDGHVDHGQDAGRQQLATVSAAAPPSLLDPPRATLARRASRVGSFLTLPELRWAALALWAGADHLDR